MPPQKGVFPLSELRITGGNRLGGAVTVHGAKNSVLVLLAACVLCRGECVLHRCPALSDVETSIDILRHLGCTVRQEADVITVNASEITRNDVPQHLMRKMRSSILFLGALAARTGESTVSFPGGCALGPRPIDLHLEALSHLGADLDEQHGCLRCSVNGRFEGGTVSLAFPSVGATEQVLLAAATASGTTVLTGGAREPEILDLIDFLRAAGAHIRQKADTIVVEGVASLHGCTHTVIPDRIEAVTYLAAAAATGGTVLLQPIVPEHLAAVLPLFRESGCHLKWWDRSLLFSAPPRLHNVKLVRSLPYPGFPTDAVPPLLAAMTGAEGVSLFVETIFENRYKYVDELTCFGAHIKTEGRVAVVEGVPRLQAASVCCTDLRGGAALVVAALSAEGTTTVTHLHHLDRGYSRLCPALEALGASIKRIP